MKHPRTAVALPRAIAVTVLIAMGLAFTGASRIHAETPKHPDPIGHPDGPGEPGVLGCCLADLTCIDATIIDCISAGGIRQPRPCSSGFCGACCTPTGCVGGVVETVCTVDFGGQYGGDQSDCTGFCLPGACCLPGGACEITMSGPDCEFQGGVFEGVETTCAGVICRGCGVVGSASTPGSALDVAVSGTLAYVVAGDGGMLVVDVADPINPVVIGSVDPGSGSGIAVSGSRVYVADAAFEGLHVIDVSDPTQPAVLGSVVTLGDFDRSVAVSGTLAFVPDAFFLHVIDVSNPANPTVIGEIGTEFATGVAVAGTKVYVSDNSGLCVIDVSDPTNPQLLGSVATGSQARDVAIAGTMAYVPDSSGLRLIDVSNPANPVIVDSVSTPGIAVGVAVSGTTAYVAHNDFGVQVIDVSDPTDAVTLTTIVTSERPTDIALAGAAAYVTAGAGLITVNASSCGRGVCCLPDGCLITGEPACTAVLGTYLGDGTTCANANCPPACSADITGDRNVGFADVLRILTEWGACP